jgi:hypothetical protein
MYTDSLHTWPFGVRLRWDKTLFFCTLVQTGSGAHTTWCTICTGTLSESVKQPGRGVDHPSHIAPRLRKSSAIPLSPSVPVWKFMEWHLPLLSFKKKKVNRNPCVLSGGGDDDDDDECDALWTRALESELESDGIFTWSRNQKEFFGAVGGAVGRNF